MSFSLPKFSSEGNHDEPYTAFDWFVDKSTVFGFVIVFLFVLYMIAQVVRVWV